MANNANYYNRFADDERQNGIKPSKQKKIINYDTTYSLVKVFGYVFIGLLITAILALGLGAMYRYIFNIDSSDPSTIDLQSGFALGLLISLIISFIGILILSFVVPITVARGKRSVLVPAIIYAVLMGIALSSLCIFIPWYLLGITFGITSLIFALMSLIAFLSKSRLNGLAIAAMGLFFGAMLISLFMLILMLVGVNVTVLYWVVSLATFAAMMLITIWDLARIKYIAEKGEMTNNLSLYCAFIIYNDFIYIMLRVLRIVLIVMGNRK